MSSYATEDSFIRTISTVDPTIDGEIVRGMAAQLQTRYSEPQRHYHTLQVEHISYMLKALESSGRADEIIELAIWFHDCVYDPVKGGPWNEKESIRVFEEFCDSTKSQKMADLKEAVSTLIEATVLHRLPEVLPDRLNTSEVAVFLDLDMGILADSSPVYEKYSQQIREEYSHYPAEAYRLGRSKPTSSLELETGRDSHDDVSVFLGYLSRAQKLEDIPAELYDLRQQGSAVLRPSPIRLHWEIIGNTTYYFLSPKALEPGEVTAPVVLRSAAAAIEILRRDWTTIEQVALNLTARGIPFNTFVRGPFPASPPDQEATPPCRGLGIRPKGFQATPSEYVLYESSRNRILRSERGRRALMMGGIIARLAVGVVPPQTVCSGPTKNVFIDGHCVWDGLPTSPAYWDDSFTQEENDTICGLYEVETGLADKLRHDGKQTKHVSWWPTPPVWKACGLQMGYWTPACEDWFQSRLADVRAGNAQLHSQVEWRQMLAPHRGQNNERLAAEFLAENATRISTNAPALRIKDSSPSDRFYFTLRTQQPDSLTSPTTDDTPETLPTHFPRSTTVLKETLKQPEIQQLTRQYWDMRREISSLALRGVAIERRLRGLNVKDPDIYLTSSELSRRLARVQTELAEERNLSRRAEHILEDIRRECKMPTVIPLLLSALIED
ncbi:hypothetical protein MVEN_00246400 [Mycena venus]|uniref:HD domain-containing protein n=1 Tax=Mycena venus TaxID=2733690 RepID=A0A8H7DF48_9AGAR|nr:hypothetical protein MVEN_00246400 [Mycena venus]